MIVSDCKDRHSLQMPNKAVAYKYTNTHSNWSTRGKEDWNMTKMGLKVPDKILNGMVQSEEPNGHLRH